ncbi:MAG: hypothetical protein PF488_02525 [Patescibacteria group bacterium]|jgi:hypothetical protein|nr:hypothetical protein [Patescibacteria group bacterium]
MKKILILPILITLLFLSACSLNDKGINNTDQEADSGNIYNNEEEEIEINSSIDLEGEENEIDSSKESLINESIEKEINIDHDVFDKKTKEIEQVRNDQNISISNISDISEKFINSYLIDKKSTATVKDIVLEDCYYKLEVEVSSTDDVTYSYIDKAGLNFFPSAFDIDSINSQVTEKNKKYSENELKERAINFINNHLMSGSKASILSIKKEDCLYELEIELPPNDSIEYSYISEDGKLFFSSILNIDEIEADEITQDKNDQDDIKITTKNNKPVVELFVMSYCPYGLQMEKAILPVVKLLGNSIDFNIKFNTYAMHGKKELDEQILQYCLMKEKEDKYLNYLECFLLDGDSNRCLNEVNINEDVLNNCISEVDKEYSISYNYENEINYQEGYPSFTIFSKDNNEYGVQGSPTLVINGQIVYEERVPNDLLNTICSAFITEPDLCQEKLSVNSQTTGFGFSESNTNSSNTVCN